MNYARHAFNTGLGELKIIEMYQRTQSILYYLLT